jgi:hypothetical protein
MAWTKDGSGLEVKRVRGRTIPQAWIGQVTIVALKRMNGSRRTQAARRQYRQDERRARQYRKWNLYSLSTTTPRMAKRWGMRKSIEAHARSLGIEPQPGELTRCLRARIEKAEPLTYDTAIITLADGTRMQWPPLGNQFTIKPFAQWAAPLPEPKTETRGRIELRLFRVPGTTEPMAAEPSHPPGANTQES